MNKTFDGYTPNENSLLDLDRSDTHIHNIDAKRCNVNYDSATDAEHPTVITMSRVRLASDTCDLYFSYIKVNLLLYTCSLDPFEDGILLDTSPVCMHRYY